MPPTENPQLSAWSGGYVRGTAAIAAVVGATGALAPLSGLAWLPEIAPATAFGLLLIAAALALLAPLDAGRGQRRLAHLLATTVLIIAFAALIACAADVDAAFFRIPTDGPPAAPLALMPLAAALLLLDVDRGRGAAEALAVAAAMVTHAVLTAHAYDAVLGSRAAPPAGAPVPAAVALGLLSLAVLLARPERGLTALFATDRPLGMITRRLLVLAILGPPLVGFLVLLVALDTATAELARTHALVATTSATLAGGLVVLAADALHRLDAQRRREDHRRDLALARSHAAERELRLQVEALSDAAATITDAVARIPGIDLDALMMVVLLEAQSLTGARYAAFGLGTDPARPFERWVHVGMTPEQVAAIGRRPRPVGLLGAVIARGRTIRLDDICDSDERIGFPPGHPPMRSFLGVPVVYAGKSHGHLYLGDKHGGDPFTDEDERAIEFLAARAGTALETARLYREEALAKAWLQGVIDGMPEAVLVVDRAGEVSFNRAARCFLCERPGHPPGLDLRDADGHPMLPRWLPLSRALDTGESSVGQELFAHRASGPPVPVLVSASPLREPSGRVLGAVCVLRDISPMKQVERLREEWTAIVAHDLRQPLSVISLSAQRLSRALAQEGDPRLEKELQRIVGASERLSRMIRDLFDAARIDAHALTVECAPVELPELLGELCARMRLAGYPLRLDLPPTLPRVRADAGRVEQVLENLLTNAIKYGDADAEIVVAARADDRAVEVSVTNRGAPLSPAEIGRLFTRFYRARHDGTVEGLGLGLYIARGLVEAHGGRIWVESGGHTTTFRLTLPALTESTDQSSSAHERHS